MTLENPEPFEPEELSWKEKLAERFHDRPLLRLLILSWPFRLAFFGMIGVVLAVVILLPKIWPALPEDFSPQIKISLLDKIQAWSLKRSARSAERSGDFDLALSGWRSAWANNPGDVEALRGVARALPEIEEPFRKMSLALQAASWLLRLGHTNQTDTAAIAWMYVRSGLASRAVTLLNQSKQTRSDRLQKIYLCALFEEGQIEKFASLIEEDPKWKKAVHDALAGSAALISQGGVEREFALVSLAYLAGFAKPPERTKAMELLRAAQSVPATQQKAYDLEFLVRLYQRDIYACKNILDKLAEIGGDTVRHYVSYWAALAAEGQATQVKDLIRQANLVPDNPWDAYQLAKLYYSLDLSDEANQMLRVIGKNVGWLLDSIVLRAEILIGKSRRGDEVEGFLDQLRSMALDLRMQPESEKSLGGYSYFLEGYVDWVRGSRGTAETAFKKLTEMGIPEAKLALQAVEHLLRIGAAQYAQSLLLPHKKELWDNPSYHLAILRCAYQLRDDTYMMESAKRLLELHPRNPIAMNNYAAALLTLRKNPQEAIGYTLQLIHLMPNNALILVNHAMALLLNDRAKEAAAILDKVTPSRFQAIEAAQYYLTAFETEWKLGRFRRARYYLKKLDKSLIYPSQVKWLNSALPQFEADAAAAEARAQAAAGPSAGRP